MALPFTIVSGGADPGGFCVRYGAFNWGGIDLPQVPATDYTVTIDGRLVSGGGWGLAARATLAPDGRLTGHAIQYDALGGGYRDVDYPSDTGPTYRATTDTEWHRLAITVRGSRYTLRVDGKGIARGRLRQQAERSGGAFVRVWNGTAELRDPVVTPGG